MLFSADIAFLFPSKAKDKKTKIGFLIVVDCSTEKIFVEMVENKKGSTIKKAFENIFRRSEVPFRLGTHVLKRT